MIIRDRLEIKGKEVLIDSNLLIYSSNTLSTKYESALIFRNLALEDYFIPIVAHQNILEMVRVLTHHKYENPYTINEALEQSQNFEDLCKVIYPDSATLEIAKDLVAKYKVTSNTIFDCYLVATMLSNGIENIATDNVKDLSTFNEIKIYNPLE